MDNDCLWAVPGGRLGRNARDSLPVRLQDVATRPPRELFHTSRELSVDRGRLAHDEEDGAENRVSAAVLEHAPQPDH